MPTGGCLASFPGASQGEPEIHDADADNLDMASDIDYGFAAATRFGDKIVTQPCLIFKQLRQSDGKYAPLPVTVPFARFHCHDRRMPDAGSERAMKRERAL
jgi:hypothetical protein